MRIVTETAAKYPSPGFEEAELNARRQKASESEVASPETSDETRTAGTIPPPCFDSVARTGVSRFATQAFLFLLVLAASVSFLPPEASAQNNRATYKNSVGTGITGISGALVNTKGATNVVVSATTSSFDWTNDLRFFACTKTSTPTSSSTSYLSGCADLWSPRSLGMRASQTVKVAVTQAMIDNGGFVFVMRSGGNSVVFGQWVRIVEALGITGTTITNGSHALEVTEGSTVTYSVALGNAPESSVTVTPVVLPVASDVTISPSSRTFDSTNWNIAQSFTVAAGEDDDITDDAVTIRHSISSTDSDYYGKSGPSVAVTVDDNDDFGVTLAGTTVTNGSHGLSVNEDGTASYTIKLDKEPTGNVTIRLSAGRSPSIRVETKFLAFTVNDWNVAQPVTVTAAADGNAADESIEITHTISGGGYGSVAVPGVTVTASDDDRSSDNELLFLSLQSVTLSPAFSRTATSYTANVPNSVSRVTVTARARDRAAAVSITPADADAVASGHQVNLVTANVNNIGIRVTAQNGDVKDYTVAVTRARSANLIALALADGADGGGVGTLWAQTLSDRTLYTANVPNSINKVKVTPTAAEAGATIKVNGVAVASGSQSAAINAPLRDGSFGILIVVVAADGTTEKRYRLRVNRKSTDAFLSGISVKSCLEELTLDRSVSGGGAAAGFRRAATAYTVSAPRDAASVEVTPTTSDPYATVSIAGAAVSRTASGALGDTTVSLPAASTAVNIVVTPEDSTAASKTYTVTVEKTGAARGCREDDGQSVFSVGGGGEVTEGDSGTTQRASFTVSLAAAATREVSVGYATADGTAEAASDYESASGTVTFSPGETSKTVTVTVNGDDDAEGDETFTLGLTSSASGRIDPQNSSARAVITNDDEKVVYAGMSGEFPVGKTTVTADSTTLTSDTGLKVVLQPQLERGGSAIEELAVTMGPTDAEIDGDTFGYTGSGADHVLVDVDVSPVPDEAVRICLSITENLRRAAGPQRLYLIRFSGGRWEELSSETEGDSVCADVSGFSPFALVFEIVDYAKRRVGDVSRAILPELTRAMTASTLEAITSRIDGAMSGGGAAAGAFDAPAPPEPGYGRMEPGLRLGELEDGETLSLPDAVDGSYYSVSLAGDDQPRAGESEEKRFRADRLGMWISGDYRGLSGKGGGLVDWDGRLLSGHLGADYRFGRDLLAGVATSWSSGSFDYTGRGEGSARVSGDYSSRMNSFHPYLGLSVSERLGLWAVGGWGFGEIKIDDGEITDRQKASTRLGTLATGADFALLDGGASALSLRGEAWISRVKIKGNGDRVEELSVRTNRLRAALEGSHALYLGSGSSLVPSLEIAMRHDGGDGETGVGGELGGGISLVSSMGLAVEARVRGLLFHQGDAKEWGVGGSVRYDPGGDERGLSMSVIPTWGNSSSGVQGIWESEGASDLGTSASRREFGLQTEVGYGFPALDDQGLLTPYGAFGRPDPHSRNYRLGSRFSVNRAFDLTLEGRRRELRRGDPEHGLTLQGRLNW